MTGLKAKNKGAASRYGATDQLGGLLDKMFVGGIPSNKQREAIADAEEKLKQIQQLKYVSGERGEKVLRQVSEDEKTVIDDEIAAAARTVIRTAPALAGIILREAYRSDAKGIMHLSERAGRNFAMMKQKP